ncbi:hypothetical protein KY348_05855, partial [Candidatus Woesearchaeota archaeon]|nr:hypothetical protein [Candidatus Woesearchaeota archaeon]
MDKKHELEKGFLKSGHELPVFEEHELDRKKEKAEESAEGRETKKEHERLPYEVVHRVIRTTCLVALVAWFVIIIVLSIITKSDPFFTLIG